MAETSCDPKDIAIAALTNLVRLMGAELVAGRHRDDLATVEQAVRDRIGAVNARLYVIPASHPAIAAELMDRLGIAGVRAGLPPRVEACARGDLVTLINHNPEPVKAGDVMLEPYGWTVIRPDR